MFAFDVGFHQHTQQAWSLLSTSLGSPSLSSDPNIYLY